MSEPKAQSAVLRDRLLQVVAYLDDVVSRSEAPVRTLAGDRTVRGVAVPDGLPGCELYAGESWLRVAKVREPAAVAVPAVLDPLIHAVRHEPDHW